MVKKIFIGLGVLILAPVSIFSMMVIYYIIADSPTNEIKATAINSYLVSSEKAFLPVYSAVEAAKSFIDVCDFKHINENPEFVVNHADNFPLRLGAIERVNDEFKSFIVKEKADYNNLQEPQKFQQCKNILNALKNITKLNNSSYFSQAFFAIIDLEHTKIDDRYKAFLVKKDEDAAVEAKKIFLERQAFLNSPEGKKQTALEEKKRKEEQLEAARVKAMEKAAREATFFNPKNGSRIATNFLNYEYKNTKANILNCEKDVNEVCDFQIKGDGRACKGHVSRKVGENEFDSVKIITALSSRGDEIEAVIRMSDTIPCLYSAINAINRGGLSRKNTRDMVVRLAAETLKDIVEKGSETGSKSVQLEGVKIHVNHIKMGANVSVIFSYWK